VGDVRGEGGSGKWDEGMGSGILEYQGPAYSDLFIIVSTSGSFPVKSFCYLISKRMTAISDPNSPTQNLRLRIKPLGRQQDTVPFPKNLQSITAEYAILGKPSGVLSLFSSFPLF